MGNLKSELATQYFRQIGLVGCDTLFVNRRPFSVDAGEPARGGLALPLSGLHAT
jgi:hypothetical protein